MSRTHATIETTDGEKVTLVQLGEQHLELIAESPANWGEHFVTAITLDPNSAIAVGRALIEAGEAMGGAVDA